MEDQYHILCRCSHPQMMLARQHHMETIMTSITERPPSSYETKLISAYHNIAILPEHYELFLGRIHPHSAPLIDQLPIAKSDNQAKAAFSGLVKHVRGF